MFRRNKGDFKAKLEHKLYLARETPEPIFDLSGCGLYDVPSGVFSLCRVFLKEVLILDSNNLSSLNNGGALSDLQNIKILNLQHNIFTSLPKDIGLLKNLEELYINDNKIKKISSAIGSLVNLRVLNISNNALKELPAELGNLSKLEYLNTTGNNITRLPSSLCYATSIVDLLIDSEKLIYPPAEIVSEGLETIFKFLCRENGIDYARPKTVPKNEASTSLNKEEIDSALQEQRQKEMLKLEKDFEEYHQKELELQAANKVNRLKILTDITQQQTKLEKEIEKIQNLKEAEKMKLIKQLQEEEHKTDLAIIHLVNLSKQNLLQLTEQEFLEDQRLFEITTRHSENLRRNDILQAMQSILEAETANFQRYDQDRVDSARSILHQEIMSNNHLTEVLKNQEEQHAELVLSIQKDMELQRIAVGALLERSDARSWGLVQQVYLVEAQLAKLTAIEMDKRKLQLEENVLELAEKRANLSLVLVDLLAQQELRRAQLISALNDMQEQHENHDDFWLMQYQKLLDRQPERTRDIQKNIDLEFAQELLFEGVVHYLPFLAKWAQTSGYKDELSDLDLIEAGVKSYADRLSIIQAFQRYKKLSSSDRSEIVATAPSTSSSFSDIAGRAPSAPALSTTSSVNESECVVCMEFQCETVFIPCGHLCCCSKCASTLTQCPLCRGDIERKIKILLP